MISIRSIACSLFFSLGFFAHLYAQNDSFESLLAKGKAEFKKDYEEQDYTLAAFYLKKAITLEPENAEAHYFLGYAYSRLNSLDGNSMIKMNLQLAKQCSDEFEQVIQLSPKYNGETVVLDPYSKITAEWGCLAMCYYNSNKIDSAVWAFNEGKRHGGFGKFFLAVNRNILSQCSKHAILISSGDNMTIPLWYLQMVEGYRKDVTVISMDLLNATWYPQVLHSKSGVTYDQPQAEIDTLKYIVLKEDTKVWVYNKYAYKDFSWILKITESRNYLSRADRIFISILKANQFESDVYFTRNVAQQNPLSLQEYFLPMILLDHLDVNGKKYSLSESNHSQPNESGIKEYKAQLVKVLELTKLVNPNSADEVNFTEIIRYDIMLHLEEEHNLHHKKEVGQLLKLLDTYMPEEKFPFRSRELKNYIEHIRRQY